VVAGGGKLPSAVCLWPDEESILFVELYPRQKDSIQDIYYRIQELYNSSQVFSINKLAPSVRLLMAPLQTRQNGVSRRGSRGSRATAGIANHCGLSTVYHKRVERERSNEAEKRRKLKEAGDARIATPPA